MARQDRLRRHQRGLGDEIHPGTDIGTPKRLCDGAGVPYTADDGHGDVVLEMRRTLGPRRPRRRTGHGLLGADRPVEQRRRLTAHSLLAAGVTGLTIRETLPFPLVRRR
ncbi:lysyl-tRNA synthetase [Streptomyces chartreusis NRRL 3882]|uniref:Lysyl-tRNA synthetase n=1 Tax=Streptomyces chartreusis NRRL 3882 TaxID=1079985 RepID=A0A2N9B265_STRCX|nr:lysyl-tRNA synthetase [Streptomyces chartreusis NRRL 3882]